MALLTRIARVLVLALLLPALLAPSGWSWQVCFCDAMRAPEGEAACCRRAKAPSCCDEKQAPAPDSHHQCGACRTFSPDNHALAPQLPPVPPAALLAASVGLPDIERVHAVGSALRYPADHSPPRLSAPVPLRI